MRIALVLDNPGRDLPGLVLTAIRLARRGATCFLLPSNFWIQEIWALTPDFLVVNFLRSSNEKFVHAVLTAGIPVGVLDTEGGVLRDPQQYADVVSSDAALRSAISGVLAWGPVLAEFMVSAGLFRSDQVSVTGCPRFDLYHPTWRPAAVTATRVDCRAPPGCVLMNASFPLANPRFVTPERELQTLIDVAGMPLEEARALQRAQTEALEQYTRLALRLAKRFTDTTILYRPHPFERTRTYAQLFEGQDNLLLDAGGTVESRILRAAAVIQCGSTTAIEAGLAGVPALSPSWVPVYRPLEELEATSLACSTEGELIDSVSQALAGTLCPTTNQQQALTEFTRRWLFQADGAAHERVADRILELRAAALGCQPKRRLRAVRRACRSHAYAMTPPTLPGKLDRWLNRPTSCPESEWHPDKHFDAGSVRLWVEALCAGSGAPPPEVAGAQEAGEFRFGFSWGKSVVIYPA